jgi:hypothetical protein
MSRQKTQLCPRVPDDHMALDMGPLPWTRERWAQS